MIDYGFRLPSAYDNRPLNFDEFYAHVNQAIFVSATPGDFEKELKKIARETGGAIELREDPSIADGFLLSYGGIEENCTLDALFAGRWNELQDVVNDRLWRESDGR